MRRPAARANLVMIVAAAVMVFGGAAAQSYPGLPQASGQPAKDSPAAKSGAPAPKKSRARYGVMVNDAKAFQGYTLIAPLRSRFTLLIDMQGQVVHKWKADCFVALSAYLLENGHLLRSGSRHAGLGIGQDPSKRVQEFAWDSELIWDYRLPDQKLVPHHDMCKLPNGNVLVIAWEGKTPKEAAAFGRKYTEPILAMDSIIEIQPMGKTAGKVVWEWHVWDHLIQDHDKSKANFGDVAAHPELIDINFQGRSMESLKKSDLEKLKAIGYLGGAGKKGSEGRVDLCHTNAVAYNAALDQVMLSVKQFSEVWIIDHSTTTREAAGHSGGRYGKGGDLLFRWGNPRTYRAGTAKDQQLFFQHDAHWIQRGLPGEGHLIAFSNGGRERPFSSVDEVVLPVDKEGRYAHKPGTAFGPAKPLWSYAAQNKEDFFIPGMCGAHRLPNGNTLICATTAGTIVEVTPEKETVWKYVIPPPPESRASNAAFVSGLSVTPEQLKKLEELQDDASSRLEDLFTDEQKEKLQQEPLGLISLSNLFLGKALPPRYKQKLKLTAKQREQLSAFEKETQTRFDKILTAEQKLIVQNRPMKAHKAGGGGGHSGTTGTAFRAYRYAPTYPGLVGRDLTPGRNTEVGEGKK
jgi:hypothetical protein